MEETVSQLMAETGAAAAGLFLARGAAVLLWGVGVDQVCLDRVHKAWRDERARLRDGRPLWQGSWCVWPTASDRGPLLLYLAGDVSLQLTSVRGSVEGLGGLLQMIVKMNGGPSEAREAQSAVDHYLKETPTRAIERRQLTLLLHEAEWNVSRVARSLGVTRATVYKRMSRYAIERLKIRKTGYALASRR